MPELPEVEYVARQLREALVGARFARVEVLWPRSVSRISPEDLAARLMGRRVLAVGRRAKYLVITLDNGESLVIHRRMSGNLRLARADEDAPYTRVVLTLSNGRRLLFTDPRKFGRITVVAPRELPELFDRLGPEPLDAEFTPDVLAERLARRTRSIKALLLDQSVVAGLGNIYADEALFRAGIHPLRPAATLTSEEITALHAGIQGALRMGIEHGGTTFGRHRGLYDEPGSNLEHVQVYQRTGQPCPHCGTPIARIRVAQRSAHFCPRCQPAPEGAAPETYAS
ncbi:MAG TPA: DNA-formamidopyrimidine glycosylase [Ktedonobacterales bacterium]